MPDSLPLVMIASVNTQNLVSNGQESLNHIVHLVLKLWKLWVSGSLIKELVVWVCTVEDIAHDKSITRWVILDSLDNLGKLLLVMESCSNMNIRQWLYVYNIGLTSRVDFTNLKFQTTLPSSLPAQES